MEGPISFICHSKPGQRKCRLRIKYSAQGPQMLCQVLCRRTPRKPREVCDTGYLCWNFCGNFFNRRWTMPLFAKFFLLSIFLLENDPFLTILLLGSLWFNNWGWAFIDILRSSFNNHPFWTSLRESFTRPVGLVLTHCFLKGPLISSCLPLQTNHQGNQGSWKQLSWLLDGKWMLTYVVQGGWSWSSTSERSDRFDASLVH